MTKDNLFLYIHDKVDTKIRNARKARKEYKELNDSLVSLTRAARPIELIEREHRLLTNPSRKIVYEFTNRDNPNIKEKFIGIEYTESKKDTKNLIIKENGQSTRKEVIVPDYVSQRIYHGVLTIKNYDASGKIVPKKTIDIYMYQPRFRGKNADVGPLTFPNGELNSQKAYMYKRNGNIYIGHIPKREILSDLQFDFENGNNIKESIDQFFKEDESIIIRNFITLEMDKINGLMVPVDFTDETEKKKFLNYCAVSSPSKKADELRNLMESLKAQIRIKKQQESKRASEERQREYAEQQAALEAIENQEKVAKEQRQREKLAQENQKMINEQLNAQKYGTYVSYNAENMAQNHGYQKPNGPHPHEGAGPLPIPPHESIRKR